MEKIRGILSDLLDREKYVEARKVIFDSITEAATGLSKQQLRIQVELYSFLMDVGDATGSEEDIRKAVEFYVQYEKELEGVITKDSYYYNLGNAKHSLARIFYSNNRGVHPISMVLARFQEPISLYWMAYKASKDDGSMSKQILINLANALMNVSRVGEALQMLDRVLRNSPRYPQALISRAGKLEFLSWGTNSPVTIALFAQIYLSYQSAVETEQLPPSILAQSKAGMAQAIKNIEEYGFTGLDLKKEIEETISEYQKHTPFRKFCIDHFLTLNEHSLYCNCVATAKDELQIGIPNVVFKGHLVPKLELLLNRIKSEFAFARWNFYCSQTYPAVDYDVAFSELFEGEWIDSQSETLRASFRICYGILDKIALGICKLYKIDNGNIFFERFWSDKSRKDVLEAQKNIHLNALYSIALDLNTKSGELKHFKTWRNKLEHNLLVLKDTRSPAPDILNIFGDKDFVAVVDVGDFKEKALHLLQLTRAAILSFVYCARLETITNVSRDDVSAFMIGLR